MIEPQGAMVDQLERWLKRQEDPGSFQASFFLSLVGGGWGKMRTYRSIIVMYQGTIIKQ